MMSQENTDITRITNLIESVRALKEELTDLENLLSRLYVPAGVAHDAPSEHERE
jgi:hypothetical protein